MIIHRFAILLVAALVLLPGSASAQEKGKTGIFMGSSGLGLIWHATERVAIRPEVSFSRATYETPTSETDANSYSVGVSALFYMAKRDNAAAYFAPRYVYTHSSGEIRYNSLLSLPTLFPTTAEQSASASQVSGSFGAQYWLGSRFSVFGEAGLAYGTGESESQSGFGMVAKTDSNAFSTRASVAAAFYF
jgi:hypothetical protein